MYQVSITRPVVTVRLCHHAASLTTIKEKEIPEKPRRKRNITKTKLKKTKQGA
jgi:ribosomal protein S21